MILSFSKPPKELIKQRIFTLLFLLYGFVVNGQNVCNPNEIEQLYDPVVSGFHSSIAHTVNGIEVWGEMMNNSGLDTDPVLSPQIMNVANYPALTGDVLRASLGSKGVDVAQGVLLTTTGLFAWGKEGVVLHDDLTTSNTFQKITTVLGTPSGVAEADGLPTGIDPLDVDMLFASYLGMAIVANGNVYVLSQDAKARGIGLTTMTAGTALAWAKVTTSAAGNPDLENIVAIRGASFDNGDITKTKLVFMAVTSTDDLYTWGENVYLGNGTDQQLQSRATLMNFPLPSGPKNNCA